MDLSCLYGGPVHGRRRWTRSAATGERRSWKTIRPADPVGIDTVIRILITPDGKSYCHDYVRVLSELFVVEGLK